MRTEKMTKRISTLLLIMLVIMNFIPTKVKAVENINNIPFSINIQFDTVKKGNVEPGPHTFSLNFKRNANPAKSGVHFDKLAFKISGSGTHDVVIKGGVDPGLITEENGWTNTHEDLYLLAFEMTQEDLNQKGWSCSDKAYYFSIFYSKETNKMWTEVSGKYIEVVYDPAVFVNTYNMNAYNFSLKKVDDKGRPLVGGLFELNGIDKSKGAKFEASSDVDGIADFTVPEGEYILSEKAAPEGYVKSDELHKISVKNGKVFVLDNLNPGETPKAYEQIVFVNKLKGTAEEPDEDKTKSHKTKPKKPTKETKGNNKMLIYAAVGVVAVIVMAGVIIVIKKRNR